MGGRCGRGHGGESLALIGAILSTTLGAPATTAAPTAPAASSSIFQCTHAQAFPRTEVERTFRTEWLTTDVNGVATRQQPLEDAQTAFTIEPVTSEHGRLAAAITLHRQQGSGLLHGSGALQPSKANPVTMGKPFVIERQGKNWCFAGSQPCPSRDKHERTFLAALGANVELLLPEPSILLALDGKASDGALQIPLPLSLLKREELNLSHSLVAHQEHGGFPALFSYETRDDKTVFTGLTNQGKPGARAGTLRIELAVDPDCRVSGVSVTQDVTLHMIPGSPSTIEFHHGRSVAMHSSD